MFACSLRLGCRWVDRRERGINDNHIDPQTPNLPRTIIQDKVKELIGIKESDTGLSLPSQWDLVSDKQMMQVHII